MPKTPFETSRFSRLASGLDALGQKLLGLIGRGRSSNVVYVDYDVICLLTSNGSEITFQLNTALPIEQVLQIAERFHADRVPPRVLARLLLTYDTRASVLGRSAHPSAQEDVDRVSFEELARDHGLSLAEFERLYKQAAQLLLRGFQRRRIMNGAPLPP